jgi:hypothetical protein
LISERSKKKTVRQFLTISELAQYLESGACDEGKISFKHVIEYIQNLEEDDKYEI